MLDKLVIGTANFGKEYNGYKVPDGEIEIIWDYCREVGIDMVDAANAYEYEPPHDFKIVNKVTLSQPTLVNRCYGVLSHRAGDLCHPHWWKYLQNLKKEGYAQKIGISLYPGTKISSVYKLYTDIEIVQVPFKAFKSQLKLAKENGLEVHVRKVFADNCFVEALKDPNVDKIVIGIDNLEQLKENVEIMRKEEL